MILSRCYYNTSYTQCWMKCIRELFTQTYFDDNIDFEVLSALRDNWFPRILTFPLLSFLCLNSFFVIIILILEDKENLCH